MTGEERCAHIERMTRAYLGRDLDSWAGHFQPDVAWTTQPDEPDAGTYHGHDGIRRVIGLWLENFDDLAPETTEIAAVGERHVIQVTRLRGRGRESGLELDAPYVFAYRFEDEMPDRVVEFESREEAVAAIERGDV